MHERKALAAEGLNEKAKLQVSYSVMITPFSKILYIYV